MPALKQSDYGDILAELLTPHDFVRLGSSIFTQAELFFGHGTDNAIDEAVALVLHCLNLSYDIPAYFWDTRLTRAEKKKILDAFKTRIEHRIPAAYITHQAWFAGFSFYVDERVLVPRSPLAELIEHQFEPWIDPESVEQVLDLCCGSGCIGIATALILPQVEVDMADISTAALLVAEENIAAHGVEGRVQVVESDLFTALEGQRYDIIISNPPYVDAAEMLALPPEYQHEPALGLAAGEDGLLLVRKILAQAVNYLNPTGILVVETGFSQNALMNAYPQVEFVWLEFQRGGSGVFLLTAEQLGQYADIFTNE